ncbi:hypothetical protein ElyMa_005492900 [Elysia marginata]|uniref:Uncharacterized protein n=1 Tax=Elysia marginata TaxID=1093978 RepID=A0AAV4ESY6_9GAST|nr:hypothetical protein ElyMa_005492900 [Elysia marginata]
MAETVERFIYLGSRKPSDGSMHQEIAATTSRANQSLVRFHNVTCNVMKTVAVQEFPGLVISLINPVTVEPM